jgi:hypothetical protein
MGGVEAFFAVLMLAVLTYVAWQGYRALKGAHEPRNALWFIGRMAPPSNDPPPARMPNREERRHRRR